MPWHDWQFWVATGGAAIGVAVLLAPLVARRSSKNGNACPGCATGAAAMKPKRTQLTIRGRR